MAFLVIADAIDGSILYQVRTDLPINVITETWPLEGKEVVEIAEPLENQDYWRVVDGECVARTFMTPTVSSSTIEADGVDETTISGLPDPCDIRMTGAVSVPWTTVTGGSVTITSTSVGAIQVKARAVPTHCPWSATINAV